MAKKAKSAEPRRTFVAKSGGRYVSRDDGKPAECVREPTASPARPGSGKLRTAEDRAVAQAIADAAAAGIPLTEDELAKAGKSRAKKTEEVAEPKPETEEGAEPRRVDEAEVKPETEEAGDADRS